MGEEEEEGDDGDLEASDDEHPVMPEPEKEQFRGKFQCKLCPHKILLTEKLLEMHLASSEHKKNEKRFERAQALGLEAYTAECKARAEAPAKQKEDIAMNGGMSKKKQKNFEHWK